MEDAPLAASPLTDDDKHRPSDGKGGSRSQGQRSGGDPRLSAEGRAAILALTSDGAFGEYLDEVCSDDLLSPL